MVQDELDTGMEKFRQVSKEAGFVYYPTPPKQPVLGPQNHQNHLSYQSLPSFTLPHRMDVLEGCTSLTDVS